MYNFDFPDNHPFGLVVIIAQDTSSVNPNKILGNSGQHVDVENLKLSGTKLLDALCGDKMWSLSTFFRSMLS